MLMHPSDRPATLHYQPSSYRVVSPGNHVICAVSGAAIPLETLCYWSVELQEAYARPELATRRILGLK